jgi:hypothetical protein
MHWLTVIRTDRLRSHRKPPYPVVPATGDHQRVGLSDDVEPGQAASVGHYDDAFRLRVRRCGNGRSGSGVQAAILRACSLAAALSVMPGKRRRNSTAADSSPPVS